MINKYLKSIFVLIVTIIIFIVPINAVFADDDNESEEISAIQQSEISEIINQSTTNEAGTNDAKPTINSRRYVIYDRNSGMEVYGKDYNKQTAMASTTKILTAIVVLENCENLNEEVVIDAKAAGTGGSTIKLNKGDKLTVNDLLYGLLLRSGNDAAVALATHIGESVDKFADLMNIKAKELGLRDSHFVTPHGLDDPEHYTTALELAKITDYALKNQKFAEIVKCKSAQITINGVPRTISNTNEILNSNVEGVYGVKTGFTNNAGRCLVTSVKRNNVDLIIVVLGADTRKDRAKDTLKLIEYAFKEFKTENIEEKVKEEFERWKQINQNRIYIYKANSKLETKISSIPIKTIVTNKDINIEISSLTYLEAPVDENIKVGTIIVKNGEDIIEQIDIVTARKVNKRGIFDYIEMIGKAIAS